MVKIDSLLTNLGRVRPSTCLGSLGSLFIGSSIEPNTRILFVRSQTFTMPVCEVKVASEYE